MYAIILQVRIEHRTTGGIQGVTRYTLARQLRA